MNLKTLLSLIFPEYCLGCEHCLIKGEVLICTHCLYALPQTDFHLRTAHELLDKFGGKLPLSYALAYLKFTKQGRVQKILHALKYQGCQKIGELLGFWYGYTLRQAQLHQAFDLIIPIPLHPSKQKKRGYNQSDCFARGLSEAMDVHWLAQGLIRTKANPSQTTLGKLARWENVSQIFEVNPSINIKGQRVLLVDDVVTTGSTLEAGLRTLYQAGAKEISFAAIAVAE